VESPGGAVLLVLTRLLPPAAAAHAIHEGLDVYLFLIGMMLLAETARHEGVFDWVRRRRCRSRAWLGVARALPAHLSRRHCRNHLSVE